MYYQLDPQAAKEAASLSNIITEKGQYTGQFTRAQHITSTKGTVGIAFDFVADDGQRARFTLYTRRENGETIYGYKQLMAIMTCLKLRGLAEPQLRRAIVYDRETRREEQKDVPQFVELLNRPIGLLLHMEEYESDQIGETKWRAAFAHAFDAATGLMAGELLDKKVTPEQLSKAAAILADRPLKNKPAANGSGANAYVAAKNGYPSTADNPSAPPAGGLADLDDDIPF